MIQGGETLPFLFIKKGEKRMKRFEKDWDLVGRILSKEQGWDMRSLTYMQKEHQKNKGWLFPFFGKDGRITFDLRVEDLVSPEVAGEEFWCEYNNDYLRNRMRAHGFNGFSNMFTIDMAKYYLIFCSHLIEKFTPQELINNKIANPEIQEKFQSVRGVQTGMKISKFIRLVMDYVLDISDVIDEDKFAWGETSFREFNYYFLRRFYNVSTDPEEIRKCKEALFNCTSELFSRLLESFKIDKHKLVISVNPVDLIFASDYTEGWTSCYHILGKPGMYSTAPFSLALDGATAIAYVFGKHLDGRNLKMRNCRVNLKRWRAFLHFSDPTEPSPSIIVGRQYKQFNSSITTKLGSILTSLYSEIYHMPLEGIMDTTTHPFQTNYIGREGLDEDEEGPGVDYIYRGDASTLMIYSSDPTDLPVAGVETLYCISCGITPLESKSLICNGCIKRKCILCGAMHCTNEMVICASSALISTQKHLNAAVLDVVGL